MIDYGDTLSLCSMVLVELHAYIGCDPLLVAIKIVFYFKYDLMTIEISFKVGVRNINPGGRLGLLFY